MLKSFKYVGMAAVLSVAIVGSSNASSGKEVTVTSYEQLMKVKGDAAILIINISVGTQFAKPGDVIHVLPKLTSLREIYTCWDNLSDKSAAAFNAHDSLQKVFGENGLPIWERGKIKRPAMGGDGTSVRGRWNGDPAVGYAKYEELAIIELMPALISRIDFVKSLLARRCDLDGEKNKALESLSKSGVCPKTFQELHEAFIEIMKLEFEIMDLEVESN